MQRLFSDTSISVRLSVWPCACVFALLLVACGRAKAPDESQIAVHVNDREISVHQVQAVLARQTRLGADSAQSAAAQVLEVLVDQELASQAAMHQGLESDPAVIQALQLARRETLARAYHESVATKLVLPTSDEVDRYYEEHPALFSQRQLYTFQELTVAGDPSQIQGLTDAVRAVSGAEAAATVVRERGLRFTVRRATQAAEDVPMGLLEQIFKAPTSRSVVVPFKGGARVVSVLHAQADPVDRRTATPAITKYLMAEKKRVAVSQSMSGLRKDARLRYVGAFSKVATAGPVPTAEAPASAPQRQ